MTTSPSRHPSRNEHILRSLPLLVFLAFSLTLAGCSARPKTTPSPSDSEQQGVVVAMIGEQPIYEQQWEQAKRYAEVTLRLLGEPGAILDERQAFTSFIEDMFIMQEAQADGFSIDESEVDKEEQRLLAVAGSNQEELGKLLEEVGLSRAAWRAELSRAVLAGAYLDEVVLAGVAPSARAQRRAAWLEEKKQTLPVRTFYQPLAVEGVRVGQLASDFTVPRLNGEDIRLSDLRGQVVLINFWATWCLPCRKEMPLLEKTYQEHAAEGLEILAVDIGEDAESVQAFVDEYGMTFPIGLDTSQTVSRQYRVYGLPMTFFINRDGVIDFIVTGALQASTLEERLKQLLAAER